MFKAYFPAAPMSKHEYTVALCPAKSLRPNKAVLIIMHRLESEPGAIGQYLQANGVDIRPALWRYPAPHDAWFPMSANDPDRYIKEEIDWIGIPLSEGKPLLGPRNHRGRRLSGYRSPRSSSNLVPHSTFLQSGKPAGSTSISNNLQG